MCTGDEVRERGQGMRLGMRSGDEMRDEVRG